MKSLTTLTILIFATLLSFAQQKQKATAPNVSKGAIKNSNSAYSKKEFPDADDEKNNEKEVANASPTLQGIGKVLQDFIENYEKFPESAKTFFVNEGFSYTNYNTIMRDQNGKQIIDYYELFFEGLKVKLDEKGGALTADLYFQDLATFNKYVIKLGHPTKDLMLGRSSKEKSMNIMSF
jgi:type III secretory pathway component EscV